LTSFRHLIGLSVLCIALLPHQAAAQDTTTGLVGHWKLDETAASTTVADSVGTNTGTMVSMTGAANTAAGQVDTALDFDGTAEYITVPDNASFDLPLYTISAWVRSDIGSGGIIKIVDKGTNFTMNWTHNGGSAGGPRCEHNNSGVWDITPGAVTHPSTGVWYHVVCSYDGTNIRGYLNAAVLGATASGTPGLNADPLAIGSLYGGTNHWFNGRIDDVRIYNRALTLADIQELYMSTNPVCSNPVGYQGEMVYNSTHNVMQFCDGAQWRRIGGPP
jgi:hypothetical protein